MSKERKIVLHFALVLFFSLLLLDIAILGLRHFSALREWSSPDRELGFFLWQLLLWELILIIAVSYVFSRLLNRYIRYKEEAREFQGLLLQALSHKLGNFLAAHRVDLELVRESGSHNALSRLESGYAFLERDFRHIIQVVRDYQFEEPRKERLDLAGIVRCMLEYLGPELERRVSARLQKAPIKACQIEVETVVFLLLENAARYSNSRVAVRCGSLNRKSYLFIKNDVSAASAKGSGVGLSIATRLARRNDLHITSRARPNTYSVLITENR